MIYRILIPSIILALFPAYLLVRSLDKPTHPSSQASLNKPTLPGSQESRVIEKAPKTNITEGPGMPTPGPQYSSDDTDDMPPSSPIPPHEGGLVKPPSGHPLRQKFEAMEESMRKAGVPEEHIARMLEGFEGPQNPPADRPSSSPYEFTVDEMNKLPREQFEAELRRNFKEAGVPQEAAEPMLRHLTDMHMRKLEGEKIPSEPERPQPSPGASLPSN